MLEEAPGRVDGVYDYVSQKKEHEESNADKGIDKMAAMEDLLLKLFDMPVLAINNSFQI